ncbi:hypothetical protein ACI1TC_07395 [Lactococcus petauri]|uniref:hypothetical protein n=1 Tax=Lactococcus petauri TaxID=1940789 RepID=UPI003853E8FD
MTKNINLALNDNTIKLGELNFDRAQFNLPKHFKVDFSKARFPKEKGKAVLSALDANTALALEKAGVDISQLKTITIEVYSGLEDMRDYKEDNKQAVIELNNPQVKLLWDIGMGSWRGVKLVTDKVTVVNEDK